MQQLTTLATETIKDFGAAIQELVDFYEIRDRDAVIYQDISVRECHALAALERLGTIPLHRLARALRLDKSTTSRIVTSLSGKGYVTRETDPEDGRRVRIAVNGKGKRLHHVVRASLTREYREVLARYPTEVVSVLPQLLRDVTAAARRRHQRNGT